jgi:16S rRNA (guanine966-N2)-methyltransferase
MGFRKDSSRQRDASFRREARSFAPDAKLKDGVQFMPSDDASPKDAFRGSGVEIVSGAARGMTLKTPRGMDVRPTAVRARKALFDSLGAFAGKRVVDLFAGSGALGFEAASRGASGVCFVDASQFSINCLHDNAARVARAHIDCVVDIVKGVLPGAISKLHSLPKPDLIFADPPYAESGKLLTALLSEELFAEWASKATIVWEMPDYGLQIDALPSPWGIKGARQFGPARFLYLEVVGIR